MSKNTLAFVAMIIFLTPLLATNEIEIDDPNNHEEAACNINGNNFFEHETTQKVLLGVAVFSLAASIFGLTYIIIDNAIIISSYGDMNIYETEYFSDLASTLNESLSQSKLMLNHTEEIKDFLNKSLSTILEHNDTTASLISDKIISIANYTQSFKEALNATVTQDINFIDAMNVTINHAKDFLTLTKYSLNSTIDKNDNLTDTLTYMFNSICNVYAHDGLSCCFEYIFKGTFFGSLRCIPHCYINPSHTACS